MFVVSESEVNSLLSAVIFNECPMCKLGIPISEDGYHPNYQPCYANQLRKLWNRYVSTWAKQDTPNVIAH